MASQLLRWPDWMPKPQRASYSYEPTDRRSRTDMEVGSILRVNYDTDESKATCTLTLNKTQAAWFEAFEKSWLAQGSRWFEMPLQSGGEINWHTVRFAARPKATAQGPRHTTFNLTLDLEKRPDVLCPEVVEILFCMSPQDLCCAAENLRHAMHDIIPSISLPDYWQKAPAA